MKSVRNFRTFTVFYLFSSRECQVKDWSVHKATCGMTKTQISSSSAVQADTRKYQINDNSIFNDTTGRVNGING